MGRILYKDIELEEANKKVHFSHSQFTERDINTDWMDSLLSIDPERFGGRSSDETSRRDLACEARDMRDGKDAISSIEQENAQDSRDCNR